MSFTRHRISVTVVRDATRDTFGREMPGTEHVIDGCLIAPSLGSGRPASTEPGASSNTVVTGASLFMPPRADVLPSDRIRAQGSLWEVEGEVGDWGPSGMQVSLRKGAG